MINLINQWLFNLALIACFFSLIILLLAIIRKLLKKKFTGTCKKVLWFYLLLSACLIWPVPVILSLPGPLYGIVQTLRLPNITEQVLSVELVEESVNRYRQYARSHDSFDSIPFTTPENLSENLDNSDIRQQFPQLRSNPLHDLTTWIPAWRMIYFAGLLLTAVYLIFKRWHVYVLATKGRRPDGSLKVSTQAVRNQINLSLYSRKKLKADSKQSTSASSFPGRVTSSEKLAAEQAIREWKICLSKWRDELKLYKRAQIRFYDAENQKDLSFDQKLKHYFSHQLILENRKTEPDDFPGYWADKPEIKASPAISLYTLHHPDIIMSLLFMIARIIFWFLPVWSWLKKVLESDLHEARIEQISKRFHQYNSSPLIDTHSKRSEAAKQKASSSEPDKNGQEAGSQEINQMLAGNNTQSSWSTRLLTPLIHAAGLFLVLFISVQSPGAIQPDLDRISSDQIRSEGWLLYEHGGQREGGRADDFYYPEGNVIMPLAGSDQAINDYSQYVFHETLAHDQQLFLAYHPSGTNERNGNAPFIEKWDQNQDVEWSFDFNHPQVLQELDILNIAWANLTDSYFDPVHGYYLICHITTATATSYSTPDSIQLLWIHLDASSGQLISISLLPDSLNIRGNLTVLSNGDILITRWLDQQTITLSDDLDSSGSIEQLADKTDEQTHESESGLDINAKIIIPVFERYSPQGEQVWQIIPYLADNDIPDLKITDWLTVQHAQAISTLTADLEGGFYLTMQEIWRVMMIDQGRLETRSIRREIQQDTEAFTLPMITQHAFYKESRLLRFNDQGQLILNQSLNQNRQTHFEPTISRVDSDGNVYLAGQKLYLSQYQTFPSAIKEMYYLWSGGSLLKSPAAFYREAYLAAQIRSYQPDGSLNWKKTMADQLATQVNKMIVDHNQIVFMLDSSDPDKINAMAGELQPYRPYNVKRLLRLDQSGQINAWQDLPLMHRTDDNRLFIYISADQLYLAQEQKNEIELRLSQQEQTNGDQTFPAVTQDQGQPDDLFR